MAARAVVLERLPDVVVVGLQALEQRHDVTGAQHEAVWKSAAASATARAAGGAEQRILRQIKLCRPAVA
jgi:hypothetical protein